MNGVDLMENLTDSQTKQVQDTVQKHFSILGFLLTGMPIPDSELLKKLGLNPETSGFMSTAFKYGILRMLLEPDNQPSVQTIRQRVSSVNLNPVQRTILNHSRMTAQQSVNNLSQRVTSTVNSAILDINLQTTLSNQAEVGIDKGKLMQQLREVTGDLKRDWHRVVQTETWNAKLYGEASQIMSGESPFTSDKGETLVYKRPAPDCCPMCRKLYLEKDGVTPKVFKMSELLSNGSNAGKKQSEWLPTLGTLHPNCACTLGIKPPDAEFDGNGDLVYRGNR